MPERSTLRPRTAPRALVVLLSTLLLATTSCARPPVTASAPSATPPSAETPAAPSVPAAPSARVAAGGPPYKVVKIQHCWVFYQDVVYYHQRGQMQALVDRAPAIETAWQPCWPDARPRNVKTSANVKLLDVRDHPGANTALAVGFVIAPVKPLRVGETLTYDLSYDAARVPYLHDEGGGQHRLLSLTINLGPESGRNQYVYAIPATSTEVSTWDATPFKRPEQPGWKLFEYDSAGMPRITMHLKFAFGARPSEPPPTPETVFSSLP